MSESNFMEIHPLALQTFQSTNVNLVVMKSQGITKLISSGDMEVLTIHPIDVEILQSGPNKTLSSLATQLQGASAILANRRLPASLSTASCKDINMQSIQNVMQFYNNKSKSGPV